MAKVAVITLTYQHSRFIESCVRSVQAQSESDWEMILVDDGSTDGTPDLVERLGEPRIRLIRQQHNGLAKLGAAYNRALHSSSAPIVAILEGDDAWPPDKLARQLPYFDDPQVVLSYGPADLIDASGRRYARSGRLPTGAAARNEPLGAILPALARGSIIAAATVMVRRSALERVGGFWQPDGIPFVDHPTWLRLALEGRFAITDFVAGCWRRHADQYSTVVVTAPATSTSAGIASYIDEVGKLAVERGVLAEPISGSNYGVNANSRSLIGQARLALLAGDGPGARRALRALAGSERRPSQMAVVLLGVLASLVGRDIEWLYRLTGRVSWPRTLFDQASNPTPRPPLEG